jgi:hypothetical protein
MKNIITLIVVLILTQFIYSCSESFFNELPTDQLTEGSYFKNGNDIEMMLNDGYFLLRTVYGNFYAIGDIASDNAYNQKFNNNYNNITLNESNVVADNGVLDGIWTGSYQAISRTNLVLDNIGNIKMDESLKKRYIGEAKFIRSLLYFNLIRIFGDVPLILKDLKTPEETFDYGRESLMKVYEQIISDLKDAEQSLPIAYLKNSDIGRATSMAAKSLLGDIYLTQKKYNDASIKFKEIIDSKSYSLLDNYSDVFDATNSNNNEIIFAVQYASGFDPSQGNPWMNAAFPNENIGKGAVKLGGGSFLMTDDLDKAFENEDQRKLMNNYEYEIGFKRRYVFTRKYYDNSNTVKVDAGNDWIIYRYADILLMYAEALNELNQPIVALNFLKEVRSRVGLSTNESLGNSKETMRLALEKERRVELNCEGKRWFDLLRTDRLINVMNAHFKDTTLDNDQIGASSLIENYELIFPLPKFQVDLNPDKLKQNPGY